MSANEIGNYHEADGWYFKRMDDGSVRIQHAGHSSADAPVTLEHIIPANTWASIVAHVSARGETSASYSEATALHNAAAKGERYNVVCRDFRDAARRAAALMASGDEYERLYVMGFLDTPAVREWVQSVAAQ